MPAKLKILFCTILSLPVLMAAIGCGGKKTFSSSSSSGGGGGGGGSNVTTSPNGGPGGTTSGIGTVDTAGFWVAGVAPNDKYTLVTRADSAYSDFCEIPNGTLDTVLNCYVDVEENDLYTLGMKLQYNVPGDMCAYLVREPYWFYDKPVGVGPTSVRVVATYDAADDLASAQCDINGAGLLACNTTVNNNELIYPVLTGANDDDPTAIQCTYECCTGNYTFIVEEDHTASGGTYNFVTDETRSWGDDFSACVGGAGWSSWTTVDGGGMPYGLSTDITSVGLNSAYTMKAPISDLMPSNMVLANYYDPAAHSHTGFVSATVSLAPYCVEPLDDLSGDSISSGSEAYSFYCLDRAFEVRNIINVYIRDWDTREEFDSYVATDGVSGDPDKGTDVEGIGCDGMLGLCNDFYDLDDFLNITLPGTYDTSDPTLRDGFFPREIEE